MNKCNFLKYTAQREIGVDFVEGFEDMGISDVGLDYGRVKRSPFTSHEDTIRDRSQPEYVCTQCHLKGTHH